MSERQPHILVIEDEIDLLEYYVFQIEETNQYVIFSAQTIREAQEHLATQEFDVVLTDLKLHSGTTDGLNILQEVKAKSPDTQVILFTGIGGTEEARQAERLKADGYLTKPLDFERVRQVIQGAVQWRGQRIAAREAISRRKQRHLPTPERLIYACETMVDVIIKASQIAITNNHLFILGEAGTGKGLIAEGIHNSSQRRAFELINCSSFSEMMLDRNIFGYYDETTNTSQTSVLERLQGGTLVLDNVSSLSLRLQDKLLAVLKSQSLQLSGSNEAIPIDIRIISIDEISLKILVKQGLFSSELYEFLVQTELVVPPLRERRDDKYRDGLILAEHFVKKYNIGEHELNLSSETEYIIENYPFPGNIRELEKTIRLALIANNGKAETILPEHLPKRLRRYGIQAGLGANQQEQKLLCPHGNFYCNQTRLISSLHGTGNNLYLRLSDRDTENSIARIGERFGLSTLSSIEDIKDALTQICATCVPIQSCQYAVLELAQNSEQVFYELGMLHALGAAVLVVKLYETNLPALFGTTKVMSYQDIEELSSLIEDWLTSER